MENFPNYIRLDSLNLTVDNTVKQKNNLLQLALTFLFITGSNSLTPPLASAVRMKTNPSVMDLFFNFHNLIE